MHFLESVAFSSSELGNVPCLITLAVSTIKASSCMLLLRWFAPHRFMFIHVFSDVNAKCSHTSSHDHRIEEKVSLCFNWAPCHEGILGGMEVQLHSFFDLGITWRWVVSFTPWPLNPQGKGPWYPLDRKLGGPQSQSGHDIYAKFPLV